MTSGAGNRQVLALENVAKTYRRGLEQVRALRGISLSLLRGEVVCISGPSGSGKTTLLNVCAGWEEADSGSVSWHGEGRASTSHLGWGDMAIVPQDLGLTDDLTIRENVELPWVIARPHHSGLEERADDLFLTLQLDGLEDRLPYEASRGQQQRASIARALILEPDLVLADEPTANQDAASAAAILSVFRAAAARGSCCLIATNDPGVAREADRQISIHQGSMEPIG